MHPHIFASLREYLGRWAHMLHEGKDISVQDLLMHMERTFGNKWDYDAMIRTLYEVQQRDYEMVEEYMLRTHEVVTIIRRAYPDHLLDRGQDLKKDRFYHGLPPTSMTPLVLPWRNCPRESRPAPPLTLYTHWLRSWKWDNRHVHAGIPLALRCIGTNIGAMSCRQARLQL